MAGAVRRMATLLVVAATLLLVAHGVASARLSGPQLLREPAVLDEDCAPQQVHLALGEDQTIMRVSWVTNGANCPSEVTWWHVRDGGSKALAADSVATAVGYSFLLTERDMCDEPAAANAFELRVHRASMAGLTPGARYRYQLPGWDSSRPFKAAAASDAAGDDEPFTFAAFGDLGDPGHVAAKSPGAAATLSQLEKEAPWLDLAVHVGDISYANGRPELWDSFMDAIEPIASRVPYHIAIGNHEYGYHGAASPADPSGARHAWQPDFGNYGPDSGGECGAAAARRFDMPADPVSPSSSSSSSSSSSGGVKADASAPAVPPFWYAFTYGPVRFVAMSTEHDCTPGSPQRAWLEQELTAVDRCVTPWVVLLAHRPLYVVYPHKANREVADHLRGTLEGLLARTAVDVVLSGHVHSYYRTCPVDDERCLEDDHNSATTTSSSSSSGPLPNSRSSPAHGAVHIVVGSGGHELSAVEEGQEDWVAAAERTHGYARITARRDALDVKFIASDDGAVLDSFVVNPSPGARAARAAAC